MSLDQHHSETSALVALSAVTGLGSVRIRQLIERFGSALAVWKADAEELRALSRFPGKVIDDLIAMRQRPVGDEELELAERLGVQVIEYRDTRYPQQLLELSDYPVLLYVKGTLVSEDKQSIAVVGTRNASLYGREMAHSLGRDLAAHGFTVVSGLARGIDTEAHAGALEMGRSFAVTGSGLANIYPQENRRLAEQIASRGALISEFSLTTPPERQNFPRRNRIVSALTLGTLLVEAPEHSGAMITVERALQQGKRLFALPGRADMESFRGNHYLLKRGQAQLVENAQDIVKCFGVSAQAVEGNRSSVGLALKEEEQELLDLMPAIELSLEELAQASRLSASKLNVLLMSLLLKKRIREFPGKHYKKVII